MVMTLHKHGFLLGEAGREKVEKAYGDLLQSQVDALTKVVDEAVESVRKARADRRLRGQQKRDHVEKLVASADDRLQKIAKGRRSRLDHDLALLDGAGDSTEDAQATRMASSFFDYNAKWATKIIEREACRKA